MSIPISGKFKPSGPHKIADDIDVELTDIEAFVGNLVGMTDLHDVVVWLDSLSISGTGHIIQNAAGDALVATVIKCKGFDGYVSGGAINFENFVYDAARHFSESKWRKIRNKTIDITSLTEDNHDVELNDFFDALRYYGYRKAVVPEGDYLLKAGLDFSNLQHVKIEGEGVRFFTHPDQPLPSDISTAVRPGMFDPPTHIKGSNIVDVHLYGIEFHGNYINAKNMNYAPHMWVTDVTQFSFHSCKFTQLKTIFMLGDNCRESGFDDDCVVSESSFGRLSHYISWLDQTGTGKGDILVKATMSMGWSNGDNTSGTGEWTAGQRRYQIKIIAGTPDKIVWRLKRGQADGTWGSWEAWTTIPRDIPSLNSEQIAWYSEPSPNAGDSAGGWPDTVPNPLLYDDGTPLVDQGLMFDSRDSLVANPILSVCFATNTGHTDGDIFEFQRVETRGAFLVIEDVQNPPFSEGNFIRKSTVNKGELDDGGCIIRGQNRFECLDNPYICTIASSYNYGFRLHRTKIKYIEATADYSGLDVFDCDFDEFTDNNIFLNGHHKGCRISRSRFKNFATGLPGDSRLGAICIADNNNDLTTEGIVIEYNEFSHDSTDPDREYYGVVSFAATDLSGVKIRPNNIINTGGRLLGVCRPDTLALTDRSEVPIVHISDFNTTYTPNGNTGTAEVAFPFVNTIDVQGNSDTYFYALTFTNDIYTNGYTLSTGTANQFADLVRGSGTVNKTDGVASSLYATETSTVNESTGFRSFAVVDAGAKVKARSHYKVGGIVGDGASNTESETGFEVAADLIGTTKHAFFTGGYNTPSYFAGPIEVGLATLQYSLGFVTCDYPMKHTTEEGLVQVDERPKITLTGSTVTVSIAQLARNPNIYLTLGNTAFGLPLGADPGKSCGSVWAPFSGCTLYSSYADIRPISGGTALGTINIPAGGGIGFMRANSAEWVTWPLSGHALADHTDGSLAVKTTTTEYATLKAGPTSAADLLHRHLYKQVAALFHSGPVNVGYGPINVSGAASHGGLIQLTTATPHGRATGDYVSVAQVAGTVEANGFGKVTVIDSTHLDLQNTTFIHTYTGGGVLNFGQVITGYDSSYGSTSYYTISTTNGTITVLEDGYYTLIITGSNYLLTTTGFWAGFLVNGRAPLSYGRYIAESGPCPQFHVERPGIHLSANDVVSLFMDLGANSTSYPLQISFSLERIA